MALDHHGELAQTKTKKCRQWEGVKYTHFSTCLFSKNIYQNLRYKYESNIKI